MNAVHWIESLESRMLFSAMKIMPLGDSITAGLSGHASYRYWLWKSLQAGGYTNVDFVGSQQTAPLYTDFDQDNEGHPGWTADQIAANAQSWSTTYKPDIVLLHIGTNDFFNNQSVSSTISDVSNIIDGLRAGNANVTILLAQITPDTQDPTQIQQFDQQIPTLTAQKNSASSKIIVVDQYDNFNPATDTYDGTHGNEQGEKKISANWYNALVPLLTTSAGNPPSGTYLSTLTPTVSTNGYGPYEMDASNGEGNAGDGHTITLNGTTYSKGLGVHAASELDYAFAGVAYSSFQADIGVDDEVGSAGSVVFQVWDTSGNKLFDSGTMTGASATQSITVNMAGKTGIKLIVTNAGDGNDSDHGDWAWARLNVAVAPPVVAAFSGATINEGGTYTASGSFTDSSSGPWTASVDYGDGSGAQSLALSGKSFTLTHVYADNGTYTPTVTVTSSNGSGSNSASVVVKNVPPTIAMPPTASVKAGVAYSANGSFADPGTKDTFSATVDYGDGSATVALTLAANKTFALAKTYASAGTYTITVVITDNDGGSTSATTIVNVTASNIASAGIPANAIPVYLSSLVPTYASNYWGPYEKDMSNGEADAGDGTTIKINGTSYAKGLGVHAPSELRFGLNGQYETFHAMVGVDDETNGNGSVEFLVYGDGVLLFDSGVVHGHQSAKAVALNVSNVSELKLIVTNGGDSNADDHADWADAKLTKTAPLTFAGRVGPVGFDRQSTSAMALSSIIV